MINCLLRNCQLNEARLSARNLIKIPETLFKVIDSIVMLLDLGLIENA